MRGAKIASMLLAGVVLLAGMACAQYTQQVIRIKVPFNFEVNGREFPEGVYSLASNGPKVLRLRDASGKWLQVILANPVVAADIPGKATLEFRDDQGRYVLARVWKANNAHGYELPAGKSTVLVAKKRNRKMTKVEGP